MTPEALQDALVKALREEFGADDYLQTNTGAHRAPNIYKQDVPIPQCDDDEDEDEDIDAEDVLVPYIIVRLSDGTFDDWGEALHVGVTIIVCTYDNSPDRQGSRDVLSILSRIFRKFAANPHVGNFTCALPIEWALQAEVETHPYYFGGMQLSFSCPGVLIEDPLI